MELEEALENVTGIVKSLAAKYQDGRVPYEDLCQVGFEGAIIAFPKYNPARGTKWSTFAYFWIKKFILGARKEPYVIALDDVLELSDLDESTETDAESLLQVQPVLKLLSLLREDARRVLILKYGFNGSLPKSRKEIAREMGRSERQIRRMEQGALDTLRNHPFTRRLNL